MTEAPPPKRRGWIDALVATALRWNDRLSRPIGESPPPQPAGSRPFAAAPRPAAAARERASKQGF